MYRGNFTISISSNDLVMTSDQQLNIDWEDCPIPMQDLQAAVLTSRELLSVEVSFDHLCIHCFKKVNLVPGVNKVKCTSCGRNMRSKDLHKNVTLNMDLNLGDKSHSVVATNKIVREFFRDQINTYMEDKIVDELMFTDNIIEYTFDRRYVTAIAYVPH